MKRRELIRHLERFGCVLVREGAKHSRYVNLADPRRTSTVPRHTEVDDLLGTGRGQARELLFATDSGPGLNLGSGVGISMV